MVSKNRLFACPTVQVAGGGIGRREGPDCTRVVAGQHPPLIDGIEACKDDRLLSYFLLGDEFRSDVNPCSVNPNTSKKSKTGLAIIFALPDITRGVR